MSIVRNNGNGTERRLGEQPIAPSREPTDGVMTIRVNGCARRAAALGMVLGCFTWGSVRAGDDPGASAGGRAPAAGAEGKRWFQRPAGKPRGLRRFFQRDKEEPAADPRFEPQSPEPWPDKPQDRMPADRPTILDRAPQASPAPAPRLGASIEARTFDSGVRKTAVQPPLGPVTTPPPNVDLTPLATPANLPVTAASDAAGRPISLQSALYGAVTGNPDLVALRQGNVASAEAVEAAKHFPTTLNPTLWVDYRPLNFTPPDTFGGGGGRRAPVQHGYQYARNYIYLSWRQPIELKHQTTHRAAIAQAAYDQQQWTVVTAELTSLVQTYRFYQTAVYRREKLRVAKDLADFNDKLLDTFHRRLEANQALPADVAIAEVEAQATRQQYEAAKQDYALALTDLRTSIGLPESAGNLEPRDPFSIPPAIPQVPEDQLIQCALTSRPEIHAARAAVAGAQAAVRLANADRTPTPIIGPEYESDEVLVQYVGFVFICPIPILNNGTPLLRQRQAELRRAVVAQQQVEQRTVAQVRATLAKWNQATTLVKRTAGLTKSLRAQVETISRLFEAGQTDANRLFQARQRLIQLENAELDAFWQATQAQSDLLLALGAPTLIASLRNQVDQGVSGAGAAPRQEGAAPLNEPNTPMPAPGPAAAAPNRQNATQTAVRNGM